MAKLTTPWPDKAPRRSGLGLKVTWVYKKRALTAFSVAASTSVTHCDGDAEVDVCAIPSAVPAAAPSRTRESRSHGITRRTGANFAPQSQTQMLQPPTRQRTGTPSHDLRNETTICRGLFAAGDNATGKLSLFVQVVARTDPVIAVGHPQRRTLDK